MIKNMLSVIIVTYKSNERTIKYVQEELCKISIPHKIVIVNNGATKENTEELRSVLHAEIISLDAQSVKESDIYVIDNPENSGFAKGNNIGTRFSIDVLSCDYLLFSNNDIKLLSDDVVEQLLSKMTSLTDAGIIGPKVIGLKGELQSPEPYKSFWDTYVWMHLSALFCSLEYRKKRFALDYSENAQEGYHYKLMGSFFMVRSNDFLKCGMMDENTFLYAEEMILTERMKKIGLSPYYYPSVSVLHDHGATTKKHLKGNRGSDIQFESNCYYYRNYMHTPSWQLFIGKLVHKLMSLK